MKKYFLRFISIYLLFIVIFQLQKPLFMVYYHDLYRGISFSDWLAVMGHGLKLDASMAGYLTMLPGLFMIASLWIPDRFGKALFKGYYFLVSVLISVIFVADLALYQYWGFRLDSTPLFYLRTPKDALASTGFLTVLSGLLAMILIGGCLFLIMKRNHLRSEKIRGKKVSKYSVSGLILLLLGLVFIPIRGGFTVSTMNTGKVYFSNKQELNHAAINPFFSLVESLTMEQDFDKQYRFMEANEAAKQFALMVDRPAVDSIPSLFNVRRPNVIFVILESFMSKDMSELGGLPDVAVRMDDLCSEGVLFTNFYANSFRTDRGLVSVFSGYPAQPTTSIMKYPHKSQSLPSIPKSLKNAGYNLQYYYGGDADFTNMRSYLFSMGIENVVSDQNFPVKDILSKWGAPDHIVFNRLASDLSAKPQKEPFLKIFQTLSSHEPFEVPYHHLNDPYLNSVAYTDSCLGDFVNRFRKTKYWENTVIILVPDHAMRYPAGLDNRSVERYKIPMLMIGGAVKNACRVDTYASQIDIAATLLHQLGIPHSEFRFSKNILNPVSPHFGYFTFPNGFGMVTSRNEYVFDCESNCVCTNSGNKNENKQQAEAFLQTLYDDLENR